MFIFTKLTQTLVTNEHRLVDKHKSEPESIA